MSVWTSLIPAAAALAGSGITSWLSGRSADRAARIARREDRRDARQEHVAAAVTLLTAALADHRRAMFVLEDLRLRGGPPAAVEQALITTHETRSAVTTPLTTVVLLARPLAETARAAAKTCYAMRYSPDVDVLESRRAAALAASDHLVDQAAALSEREPGGRAR